LGVGFGRWVGWGCCVVFGRCVGVLWVLTMQVCKGGKSLRCVGVGVGVGVIVGVWVCGCVYIGR